MRTFGLILFACFISGSTYAQEPSGTALPALSRCAGKVARDARQADPAFVTIALDGRPWITIDRTDELVGTQQISTTVTGTGWRRRRNGTSVPFRFTCMLDDQGQALVFHISNLVRNLGDELPPSIIVHGAASYLENIPLPKGVELQVQLLDTSKLPAGEVLAEQVVRSGWYLPIPFALRLPKETSLADRKLVITARFVLARETLFQLQETRIIAAGDVHEFIILTLDKVKDSSR